MGAQALKRLQAPPGNTTGAEDRALEHLTDSHGATASKGVIVSEGIIGPEKTLEPEKTWRLMKKRGGLNGGALDSEGTTGLLKGWDFVFSGGFVYGQCTV
jgi:hypothetical protein